MNPRAWWRKLRAWGCDALAILDVDGMYSTVQTTMAARAAGLPIVYGAELTLAPDTLRGIAAGSSAPGWGLAPGAEDPGMRLPILAASPSGYAHLVGAMSDRALSEPGQRHPRHDLVNLSEAGGDLRRPHRRQAGAAHARATSRGRGARTPRPGRARRCVWARPCARRMAGGPRRRGRGRRRARRASARKRKLAW